ncbi:MAG: outer membrane protein transport protein, partial [Gammaproteobacteria bacterium]
LWDYDTTRVGLSYRDSITHHLNGNARFEDAPSVFTSMGLFTDSRIYADFKTPEITSLSLVHDFNKQWSMAADFTRTGWSKFQELRIQFVNPNQPDSVTTEKWKDVNRFSVGLNWRYSDDWTFRTGVAQDQSPVRDAYRTPRLPDDTRTWLAFGATWRTGADSQWDVGYSHLFINGNNIPIDQTGATGDRLVGSYKASADIFGISYRHTY